MPAGPLVTDIRISVVLNVCEIDQPEDLFSPFNHLITGTRTIMETSTIGPTIIFGFKNLPTQAELDKLCEEVKKASEGLTLKINHCSEGHQPDARPYSLGLGQVDGFHIIDSKCGHFGERFDTRKEAIEDWNKNNPNSDKIDEVLDDLFDKFGCMGAGMGLGEE